MDRRVEITVDHNRCVGSTLCVMLAPGAFALNESGQSIVRDPAGEALAAVLNAAEQCPMSAIHVRDAATGELLFGLG